jgi:large subunit ribosomal protein L3
MIQALIGKKINQTQKFLENGSRVPVTQIAVPDNAVVQVKTQEKDHYTAVQIGYGVRKHATKAQIGHAKKANQAQAPQVLKEIRVQADELPQTGDMIALDQVFKPGDIVAVTGTSKGKGFAGVVKRHNFRGGPKTHGQSDRLRAPGSIGQTTTPGRVYRGKRMAGRMGQDVVTVKNLKVVDLDVTNKMLYIAGLVPGALNSIVYITRTGEQWKHFSPVHKIQPTEAPNQSEEAPQSVSDETPAEAPKEVKAESKVQAVEETRKGEQE